MRWGDYPELSRWAQSNHMRPSEVEEEGKKGGQIDVTIEKIGRRYSKHEQDPVPYCWL